MFLCSRQYEILCTCSRQEVFFPTLVYAYKNCLQIRSFHFNRTVWLHFSILGDSVESVASEALSSCLLWLVGCDFDRNYTLASKVEDFLGLLFLYLRIAGGADRSFF